MLVAGLLACVPGLAVAPGFLVVSTLLLKHLELDVMVLLDLLHLLHGVALNIVDRLVVLEILHLVSLLDLPFLPAV